MSTNIRPVGKHVILLRKAYEMTENKLALTRKLCLVLTDTLGYCIKCLDC